MSVAVYRLIELLLYPPGNLLLFLLLALLFRQKRQLLLLIGVLQILFFSLPIVSVFLIGSLQKHYPPKPALWQQQRPQAIVVLGGGRIEAPEYGGETINAAEIERVRYAAWLHQQTGLPILAAGGKFQRRQKTEAELIGLTLRDSFKTPVKWLENKSHTTWQNAEYTDAILSKAGITSAWLVTHSWHMPRSMQAFANRKVSYLPAPLSGGSYTISEPEVLDFVPSAISLKRSCQALHEWLGILWYQLRYVNQTPAKPVRTESVQPPNISQSTQSPAKPG